MTDQSGHIAHLLTPEHQKFDGCIRLSQFPQDMQHGPCSTVII